LLFGEAGSEFSSSIENHLTNSYFFGRKKFFFGSAKQKVLREREREIPLHYFIIISLFEQIL